MKDDKTVTFEDSGREPVCQPDPDFPDGMEIDLSRGKKPSCDFDLPYPAPRCGMMIGRCKTCGVSFGITVAGRVDDPKRVTIPCNPKLN